MRETRIYGAYKDIVAAEKIDCLSDSCIHENFVFKRTGMHILR